MGKETKHKDAPIQMPIPQSMGVKWNDTLRKGDIESIENITTKYLIAKGCYQYSDKLLLLTPQVVEQYVPKGTELTSISGRKVTVGRDSIDSETRIGVLAFGILRDRE